MPALIKDTLSSLLDIPQTDTSALAKLELLIDICTEEAKSFTNQTDNEVIQNVVIAMVSERWSKLGSEGLNSASFNGVNESFIEDYSLTVQRLLRAKRRLKVI